MRFLPHDLIKSSSLTRRKIVIAALFRFIPCAVDKNQRIRFHPLRETFQLVRNIQQRQKFYYPGHEVYDSKNFHSVVSLVQWLGDFSVAFMFPLSQNYLILTSPLFHNSSRNSLMSAALIWWRQTNTKSDIQLSAWSFGTWLAHSSP